MSQPASNLTVPPISPIDDIASQTANPAPSIPPISPIDDIASQFQPDPTSTPQPQSSQNTDDSKSTDEKQNTINKIQEEVKVLEQTKLKQESVDFKKVKATLPIPDPPPVPQTPAAPAPVAKTPVSGRLKEQKDAQQVGSPSPEHAPIVERSVEFESPPEIQPWVEAKPDPVISTIPTPVEDEFGEILLEASNVPKPNIILPIDEAEIKKALHHRVIDSVRWLGEWCKRIVKVYPKRVAQKQPKNDKKQVQKKQSKGKKTAGQALQPQQQLTPQSNQQTQNQPSTQQPIVTPTQVTDNN